MKRLIIDGFNLAFRAHFSHQDLRTTTGLLSGCFYGFITTLQSIKSRFPSHHITIAWDTEAKRKKEMFPDYKASRPAFSLDTPILDLKKALYNVDVWQAEMQGEEADDVIASLAEKFSVEDQVIIYSRDKDLLQLVNDNRRILAWWPKVGLSPEKFLDEEAVKAEFGVLPRNLPCLLSLRGDPVDDIPGIPRVKTSLLADFSERHAGDLDAVYAGLKNEKLTEFQRGAFRDHEVQVKLNWKLVKLATDLQVLCTVGKTDVTLLQEYFDKYQIARLSAEKYVKNFGDESTFLERENTPLSTTHSLF